MSFHELLMSQVHINFWKLRGAAARATPRHIFAHE
jgi:hypothetical protein